MFYRFGVKKGLMGMNTIRKSPFFLEDGLDYVFCNEDLEPTFERADLHDITEKFNNGETFFEIAHAYKRDPDEIFLAILHQARLGKTKRKINIVESVRHVKYKKGIPTVIMYDGRRYVHEET